MSQTPKLVTKTIPRLFSRFLNGSDYYFYNYLVVFDYFTVHTCKKLLLRMENCAFLRTTAGLVVIVYLMFHEMA